MSLPWKTCFLKKKTKKKHVNINKRWWFMFFKIFLFYFEVNITFCAKKSLTSITSTGWLWNRFLPSLLTSAIRYKRILFLTLANCCFRDICWSGRKIVFIWAANKFFSLMSWMEHLVILLRLARFLLGGWERLNM